MNLDVCDDVLADLRPLVPMAALQNPGTFAELLPCADAHDELQARVLIYNSGPSAASAVVVRVPLPAGFASKDASDGWIAFRYDVIAPGEAVEAKSRLCIASPLPSNVVALAGIRVACAETGEFGLPPAVLKAPPPDWFGDGNSGLSLEGSAEVQAGERVVVRLSARNDGNTTVADLRAQLVFPRGLRYAGGSARLNGNVLPHWSATGRRRGLRPTVHLQRLVPGESFELEAHAYAVPSRDEEEIVLRGLVAWGECGARSFDLPVRLRGSVAFPREHNRIELGSAPEVVPGETVRFTVFVRNGGTSAAEVLRLEFDASGFASIDVETLSIGRLEPYEEHTVTIEAAVPTLVDDRSVLRLGAHLYAGEREVVTLTPAAVCVHSAPEVRPTECRLERVEEAPLRPKCPTSLRIRAKNDGTCAARNVRAVFELPPELELLNIDPALEGVALGDIAPAQSVTATATIALVAPTQGLLAIRATIHADGISPTPLEPMWIPSQADPDFSDARLAIDSPAATVGETMTITLRTTNLGDGVARRVSIQSEAIDGTTYLCGSTTINGFAIVDGQEGPALYHRCGLIMEHVEPNAELCVSWSLYIRQNGQIIAPVARLQWDASEGSLLQARPVEIGYDCEPEGTMRRPFRIEPAARAVIVSSPSAAQKAVVAPTLVLELSPDAVTQRKMASYLRDVSGRPLISHVLSLRALAPSGVVPCDSGADALLRADQEALRNVLDRLYIKLRIPNYELLPRDLEDGRARGTLKKLLSALQPRLLDEVLDVTIATLQDAPIGDHSTFVARSLLIPTACGSDSQIVSTLRDYRAGLLEVFKSFENLSSGAFSRQLLEPGPARLDTIRHALIEALGESS